MFENVELPIKFDDQPVMVGDQFRFIPNGIIHTVVFREKSLRFLFELESSDKKEDKNYVRLVTLVKNPEKWERYDKEAEEAKQKQIEKDEAKAKKDAEKAVEDSKAEAEKREEEGEE